MERLKTLYREMEQAGLWEAVAYFLRNHLPAYVYFIAAVILREEIAPGSLGDWNPYGYYALVILLGAAGAYLLDELRGDASGRVSELRRMPGK